MLHIRKAANYVALLNEWTIGFYAELDIMKEGRNKQRLRNSLVENSVKGVTVPKVYSHLCTRRILVSEWMDGVKLSECSAEQIKEVTAVANSVCLFSLFSEGFFHADPHPKSILLVNKKEEAGENDAKIALIDYG